MTSDGSTSWSRMARVGIIRVRVCTISRIQGIQVVEDPWVVLQDKPPQICETVTMRRVRIERWLEESGVQDLSDATDQLSRMGVSIEQSDATFTQFC